MQKIIISGIVLILLACCKSTEKPRESLPAFDLLLVDSVTIFNTAKIAEGRPIVLVYFSPDCEHCQKLTEGILQKMDSLRQVQFYFITNDPFERLHVYNLAYKLYKYHNITLGRDYSFSFLRHFKEASPPYLAIYDKNRLLRGIFHGETSTSQIISYIAFINT